MAQGKNLNTTLRAIPSVDKVLSDPGVAALAGEFSRERVRDAVRELLAERRRGAKTNGRTTGGAGDYPALVRERLVQAARPSLVPVINATGVIVHTNLGRAPLAEAALDAVARASRGYANLEYDIPKGARGNRDVHAEALVRKILGVESAFVVNNNAAAVLLALRTLARGKDVLVSRGELVEIGGSFRIPEILAESGAALREVGTTNRTRLADYERAFSKGKTGAILKVHPSNYRVEGFTEAADLRELSALARKKRIPLVYDLGSGHLTPVAGLNEPTVSDELRRGADVVCFSGDKLLGGPQAGILAGRKKYLDPMKRNPLARALRADKTALAALEATLALHYAGRASEIPVLRMAALSYEATRARAEAFAARIRKAHPAWSAEVKKGASKVGGGTTPMTELPSAVIALSAPGMSATRAAERLRMGSPPVVARVEGGRLVLDLRTVREDEEAGLLAALGALGTI